MPELAEVEFYRRQWNAGLGQKVRRVALHSGRRLFRGTQTTLLIESVEGARLLASEAHGKKLLFRFSRRGWLGLHLGMSGKLRVEPTSYEPAKHDHLALFQRKQTLVFSDPRMFGRVLFHRGKSAPQWWTGSPPAITSDEFTLQRLRRFLERHARLAVKAALLNQTMFPGVGNWMADEILWRACIDPRKVCGSLSASRVERLWTAVRGVCAEALATVGANFSDPPPGWLFHERWRTNGRCPRDERALATAEIGGRTTRWCRKCQH